MRIFFKLIGLTVVLLVVFIALFYFVFYAYLRSALIEEQYFSTVEETNRIFTNFRMRPEYLRYPLSDEAKDWHERVTRFLQTSDVEDILVWNVDDTLISSIKKDDPVGTRHPGYNHVGRALEHGAFYTLEESPTLGRESKSLHVTVPMIYEGDAIGVIEIRSTLASLLYPVDRYALRSLTVLVFLTILLLIGMTVINHRVIIAPIQYLKAVSARLKNGEFDVAVTTRRRDELGELIRDFDDLRGKLKSSFFKVESEKERLLTSLRTLGEAVFVIDKDRRITFANDAAQKLLSQKEESIGREYQEVLRFVDEKQKAPVSDFIGSALSAKAAQLVRQGLLVRTDGGMIPVSGNAAPIFDAAHVLTGAIVVIRDETTERAIDKMKSEFISLASHQLRTPLSAIRWSLESMHSKNFGKISAKQKEFVKIAFDATMAMNDLISRLLNISRIEAGRLAVTPKEVVTKELVGGIVRMHSPKIIEKKHKVVFTVDDDLVMFTDPRLIEEIISNLLSNAIKYTPPEGNIHVTVKSSGRRVSFTIKDSGFGIPKNEQKRVFQKFFRAENIVTSEPEGNGLGLYLVRQLVELLEGEISFESTQNVGTTFYLTFPKRIKGRAGERTFSS